MCLNRLRSLRDRPGDETRTLDLGCFHLVLEGLDRGTATELDARWGPFLGSSPGSGRGVRVGLFSAGDRGWLPRWQPAELYRIEVVDEVVVSYHFAIHREAPDRWRVGITETDAEPRPRIVDNVARFVCAVLAVEAGGFAIHGAGVLHRGEVYLFAGPSGAGKSTAVRLARPAVSTGDDYAMILPCEAGWCTPAVPFDNAESVPHDAPRGVYPLAGVWRLNQAAGFRQERPPGLVAAASLMGCVAFPWAMPDRSDELLSHVREVVTDGRFATLDFARDTNLWTDLLGGED